MRSSKIEYFAFGSNMCLVHLREWLCRFGVEPDGVSQPRHAILPGFRLRTNYLTSNALGAANIEPSRGQQVEGVLIKASPDALVSLDRKEGHPCRYNRINIEVMVPPSQELIKAVTYRVTEDHQLPFDLLVSTTYRDVVLAGAKEARLSEPYQEALKLILKSPMMFESPLQPTS